MNETPSALTESIRAKPKVFGGGIVEYRLLLGDTNTISADLTRFNFKLFLLAHDSILLISDAHDGKFEAGTMRWVSSAYLSMELPSVTG